MHESINFSALMIFTIFYILCIDQLHGHRPFALNQKAEAHKNCIIQTKIPDMICKFCETIKRRILFESYCLNCHI